jgi:hypothetical protein
VGLGRVELPTNGLGNRCSIHLSYRPWAYFIGFRRIASKMEMESAGGVEFFVIRYQESVNSAARGCPTASGGGSVGSLKSAVQDQLAISGRSSKFCRI